MRRTVLMLAVALALPACTASPPTPAPSVTSPRVPGTGPPDTGGTSGPPASGPAPSVADLPTLPWWGGPAYYAAFPKAVAAGWTAPSFFPIAVFYGRPSHSAQLAAVGINTFLGAEHEPAALADAEAAGVSIIAPLEWTAAEIGDSRAVVGWHVSDECEMGLSDCTPDWTHDNGEQGRLAAQRRYVENARGRHDGRFVQANFGAGVLGTFWAPTTMADHVGLVDVTSVDEYAFTSPHVRELVAGSPYWPTGVPPGSARAYGWMQDRMELFATPPASKPNWVLVETARPLLREADAVTIRPAQISGAVWNALIHGAAGVAYFQHNDDPRCGMYSLIECGAQLRQAVAAIDREVTGLAPVLNSPSYEWTFGEGLDTALKHHDGYAYVLAMATAGGGQRTFRLPPGVVGTTVEVVGEHRTVPVRDGVFRDRFATADTHHVYRVAAR